MKIELHTIGYSKHSITKFIDLLRMYSISAVCDVRSTPYSRFNPQFNRESLQEELRRKNISYVFLGKELGARSNNPKCYVNGKVQYNCLAQEPEFFQGLKRLEEGIKNYRIAIMCAEKDPATCHRTILVCRHLRFKNINIKHILADGKIENNDDLEGRLLDILKISQADLFASREALIERAYDIQGENIAYEENTYTEMKEKAR